MNFQRSLLWRIALAYAALILIFLAALFAAPLDRIGDRPGAVYLFLGLWAGAFGVLAAALGCWAAHYSARPVRSITQGSRRLAAGDLDYRLPPAAAAAAGEMTDAFNRMADSLKAVIGQLSAERDTLSAVLDTMADGVIVTEAAGRVMLLNPAARELMGIEAPEVAGSRLIELVRDNEIHRLVARCQGEKSRQQGEVSLLYPRRYLSAIATPLDGAGAPGVLLTLHDLTRIRQVETSQKEFVSNVSHELRNPMASIKAMVETLESGAVEDPAVAADFLGRMRQDVDRINHLVNDLLELSRMESGQFSIAAEPVSLAGVAQGVKRQFREMAAARGVTIESQVPEDLPLVMADGDKLNQVLVNLVENSLKFSLPQGRISLEAQPAPGCVEVRLRDTGIGVAPQHLPHLFERFYKVDRARRDGGTGLGLAIVKQLVEAHGGRITVESREGEGCVFTFTVPTVPDIPDVG